MSDMIAMTHMSDMPSRTEAEQLAFFDAVMTLAIEADTRARTGEYFLSIAGAHIRLLFAGEALQRDFLPALSNLQTRAVTRPDATFYVWDSAATGIDMVPRPCPTGCFTDRGDIWGFDSPRIRSAFHWGELSVNVMDTKTGLGSFWVQTSENLPYWAKASPLRTLFHWLMSQRGCHLLHAAAIGTEDGGVLISGKGGVGKSTTALACLAAGMKYVADDYLVVQLDPKPKAFSLYGTAKLERQQLLSFRGLQSLLDDSAVPPNEKAVLHLSRSDKYRVTPSLPLIAALTPSFAPGPDTTMKSADPALLVNSAAFTTMAQLPHAGRATHDFIARLMNRLPCFEIFLGQDVDKIPVALSEFLRELHETAAPPRTHKEQSKDSMRPFVSVIIPAYNGAHFLKEAVDSIRSQNYSPLEIIVVDDGSTDGLDSAVRALSTDVRLLGQHNVGPAAARNLGLRNAAGEFLTFLDVDDLWPQNTLATLVGRLLERPELDVVQGYGQLMRLDKAGGAREFLGGPLDSFPYYIGSALYRRRAFEQVGLFDADLRFSEDIDWFSRAREKGISIERLDRVTLLVRRHDGNVTKNKNLQELNALRVFKKALDRRRKHDASVAWRDERLQTDDNANRRPGEMEFPTYAGDQSIAPK